MGLKIKDENTKIMREKKIFTKVFKEVGKFKYLGVISKKRVKKNNEEIMTVNKIFSANKNLLKSKLLKTA